MCGRFLLTTPAPVLGTLFDLPNTRDAGGRSVAPDLPRIPPRYNIAPGAEIAIIRVDGVRTLSSARWGQIPGWAREGDIGARTIAAGSGSIHLNPSFREAFFSRRCVVPADGFYEWAPGPGGTRRPWLFRVAGSEGGHPTPFGMAALWDTWRPAFGSPIDTVTILTVPANSVVARAHDRMPAVLRPEDIGPWLGDVGRPIERADDVCRPWPDRLTMAHAVGHAVNSPRAEGPRCAEPVEDTSGAGFA